MTVVTAPCPSSDTLERLLGETLDVTERTAVEAHVETCTACQERLEQLVTVSGPVIRASGASPETAPDEAFLNRLRQLPPVTPREPDANGLREVGPYEILGRLGCGGMGTVYRARHRDLDKVVALKVLPADRVDEMAVARFRNEMRAAGRLAHPNLVAATDAGRAGGTYYLAMDFVDGLDLGRVVERGGRLPTADACEVSRQAAVGLAHAHEMGLVHRDVKPSNLMLARGGAVKVLDLGLARVQGGVSTDGLTASGVLLGTADYIAPEQIGSAQAADPRADVYGLGGTLYFLLAGAPPFAGDRHLLWLDKLRAHQVEPVPPLRTRRPDVPTAVADLVERMLAKDPADRPTPADVIARLQPFAAGAALDRLLARVEGVMPSDRPVATASTRTPRPVARPRRGFGRYALAAAAGAAVTALALFPFVGPRGGKADSSGGKVGESRGAEEIEGIRLTFGPNGPPRPDHKVLPGETVHLEYTVGGVGKDPAGEVNLAVSGELVDQSGKRWAELAVSTMKGPTYLGGAAVGGWVSFDLAAAQPPGEYKAKVRVADRVTGRVANFEHPVYVLRPEFGGVRLRLTHDPDGVWPTGCHVTVGQQFYVHGRAVGYTRKDGRIHVTLAVSARDPDGKETTPEPLKPLKINQAVGDDFVYFDFKFGPLKTIMAGEATITVEVRDEIAGKVMKYELPVVIHPPRAIGTVDKGR